MLFRSVHSLVRGVVFVGSVLSIDERVFRTEVVVVEELDLEGR